MVHNAFRFALQGEDGVPGEDGRKVCGCLLLCEIILHWQGKLYFIFIVGFNLGFHLTEIIYVTNNNILQLTNCTVIDVIHL